MSSPALGEQAPPLQDKSAAIIIVGAGIFGLSTAIHLAQRGFRTVTIFDKQPYHESQYSYFRGCDSASADMNKIFRSAYGAQTEYQALSFEATNAWLQWNSEIASGNVPVGMFKKDKLLINNGNLSLTDQPDLAPFEQATIQSMNAAGQSHTQLVTYDSDHVRIAEEQGFAYAIDPFERRERGQSYLGVLDTTGGTIVADKACRFALHKACQLGVRTVFGPQSGAFDSFVRDDEQGVVGIRTVDGVIHHGSRVIVACGGWTPALIPSLDSVCETTAGSVVIMKLPPDLAHRYSAAQFPSWMYKIKDGAEGGLYGFPVTDEGYMKVGYRGTKYTNPRIQSDGKERSIPITCHTQPETIKDQIPVQALKLIKQFIADYLPDLPARGVKIDTARLCWYNDSWDANYVIDHVPGHKNVLVATAGSGHAFKYLPNIGAWVADILEGKDLDRELIRCWRWRARPQDSAQIVNVLMEGSSSARALDKTKLSTLAQLRLADSAKF